MTADNSYGMALNQNEKVELVENFHRFNKLKHSTVVPTAFTEKGMYMLATILKSPKATQTTLDIVEAFAKIRELSRTFTQLSETKDEPAQKSLLQKNGEIMGDILGDNLEVTDAETTWEVNLALMKFKRTVKQKKKEE